MNRPAHGALHHVEIWVPDLDRAPTSLGWLLETLGYTVSQSRDAGRSWLLGRPTSSSSSPRTSPPTGTTAAALG